jgi:predicted dehydrogenase
LDVLRVGFIGSGFIAGFMTQAMTAVRGVDITAICNPNIEGAKRLAARCEALGLGSPAVYGSIHDMISRGSVDAVWVINPNNMRLETIRAVVEETKQGRQDLVGVCCEKPLGRTADEAEEMLRLVEGAGLLHGYLENQVFAPGLVKGRDSAWSYGAKATGRPYLARAAEEHSGPHMPWFWDPIRSGGGVLLDMGCHSIEAGRFMLTDPKKLKSSLEPLEVQATIAGLKWSREPGITQLRERFGIDYSKAPAEDYASVLVKYNAEGEEVIGEARMSWCYTGPGLRLSFELLGPEYSVSSNSLQQELNIFLGRNVAAEASEDFIEKQAAEQGLIPVIADEAAAYGYVAECRHMVDALSRGVMPRENWHDGLLITRLMMLAYKSSEEKRALRFSEDAVRGYRPSVADGKWKP